MNDFLHRTDTLNPFKVVTGSKQIRHWIEYQLLDEQGEPVANMPYLAINDAIRAGLVAEYVGQSDAQGVIRLEGLHPLAINLKIESRPLIEQMQTRRLRAERPEPPRPGVGDRTPLYGHQRSGFSPIEQQAIAAGHGYHYLRIGQLCDRKPTFDPPLADPDQLPEFHFPDRTFSGFSIGDDQLDRRHVLETCPFRAWSLVLHHQAEYSLANAYNLGLMSILAYSTKDKKKLGSAEDLFEQQCLDLSRTPKVWDDGQNWPCLVIDVPFNDRYVTVKPLDTAKSQPPEGNTQLIYAISASQVLVAWRGTEMDGLADLITDVTFRPVKPEVTAVCESKVPCDDLAPEGSVHLGFRNAFEVARRVYAEDLGRSIPERARERELFICGHSLGGALGLVHAASLKKLNPLLYTYGMPRTFTLKAAKSLGGFQHFRHVNDTDLIPSVPPEAALDNYLYDLYGPLGATLGFTWSLVQLTANSIFNRGDPYCHHGEIAMFFKTEQHVHKRGSDYPAYRNKEGLGAPYYETIAHRLQEKAKLYLVPHLDPEQDKQAEQAHERLFKSLNVESRARFFPPHSNPKDGQLVGIGHHFMSKYQPFMYSQLLESITPERNPLLKLQRERRKFEEQMKNHYGRIPEEELLRNRIFLELQSQVGHALLVTRQVEGGVESLQRFDAVADPHAYYPRTYE
jgi:hypothetical protein